VSEREGQELKEILEEEERNRKHGTPDLWREVKRAYGKVGFGSWVSMTSKKKKWYSRYDRKESRSVLVEKLI